MSRAWWLPRLGLLVAAGLAGACGRGAGAEQAPGAQGMPPMPVQVATIEQSPVEDSSEYVGTLKAMRSTSVRPQVDGHITSIFVKSGDRVSPGTQMVQIDPARQRATVETQEASVSAREADVQYAQQQFDRLKELYAQRVVSKAELDQAETALKTAQAALASTRAQVHEGQVQLRYYALLAPTAGVVGDIPVRVGDRVSPDTQITTIDSNEQLEVLVPVPGERATDLRMGLPLQLVDRDGQKLADTTVTFISPRVDPETQAVLVKGLLRNPGQLRSQQFVRVRVVWATRPGLTIPVLSVVRFSGQPFVFVAEEQKGKLVARQRPVKLGPIVGDAYSVVDGVKPGDRVVVSGVQKLADGAPIAAGPPPGAPGGPGAPGAQGAATPVGE